MLYLVRHGQTEYNKKNILMGQMDIPLNELGEKQAKLVAQKFKDIKLDALYTSDLKRAYATAQEISKITGLEPITNKGLRENTVGFLEGMTIEEVKEKYPQELENYQNDEMFHKVEGGESRIEFMKRVDSTISKIVEENPNKNLCLVSHGGTIRSFISQILSNHLQLDIPKFFRIIDIDNCSISRFKQEKDKWIIVNTNETV